ncbi:MAG: YfhO family protein [Bryobacteraceae bacterium]
MPPKTRRIRPARQRAAVENIDWLRRLASGRAVWLMFIAAVLLFYAGPLFEERATIQWDAADYHYSAQKYFAGEIHSGRLPHWTPYPYSGMPFLADIQVGAWYPLNWPFFLMGVTPRAIEWELALHCLVAFAGAWLLGLELTGDSVAALFAGGLYAFSGFFVGHSSHVGMFQCASLFPWLLWSGIAALRRWRWLPAVAAIAAGAILAGHFQSALYATAGFGLFLVVYGLQRRVAPWRIAAVLGCALTLALGLTAIQTLPGLELTRESNRSAADFGRGTNSSLVPGALATLVDPDHYHAPGGDNYTGPEDITQFYFYQGLLLVPLAALGALKGKARLCAAALAVPALWYAFGPAAGFYLLVARLPGFRSVRAPVHVWFVIALALALLAASGALWLSRRFPYGWIPIALLAVFAVDLWYWNMGNNALAYARISFPERYGDSEDRFRSAAESTASGPLRRIWAPFDSPSFGPLNGMLDSRIEVTYGYNPFELARYSTYIEAAKNNPRLLDSLAVTAKVNVTNGRLEANPTAMPRVSAPPALLVVHSRAEAAAKLASLDPVSEAVVEGPAIAPTGAAQAEIRSYTGNEYRIAYRAAGPALLRIAVPYFPGWRAEVDGRALPVFPVDLALSGVAVPPGSHELVFRYESNWFRTGALISVVSWIGAAVWFAWPWWSRRFRPRPVVVTTPVAGC